VHTPSPRAYRQHQPHPDRPNGLGEFEPVSIFHIFCGPQNDLILTGPKSYHFSAPHAIFFISGNFGYFLDRKYFEIPFFCVVSRNGVKLVMYNSLSERFLTTPSVPPLASWFVRSQCTSQNKTYKLYVLIVLTSAPYAVATTIGKQILKLKLKAK
jgi:hypothetical protein